MKSLFTKIRQIGTSGKKSSTLDSEEDDDPSRSYAFPKVAQSRNDTQLEVAQTLYGRSTNKANVKFTVSDILGKGHYGLVFLAEKDTTGTKFAIKVILAEEETRGNKFAINVMPKSSPHQVFLAEEETTGTKFAIKVMRKEQRNINKYAYIEEAVLRMSRSCPFIIHLFSSFQTTTSYYLVMEHAYGGNLKQIIDEYGCLTIDSTRFLTAELILALHFLHSNGVIHRDLKIQNILMTTGRHIRLIDFGLSRMDIYDGDTTNSGCGTPFYMAPEILRRIPYSHEVDWWAMGVLMYKLVTGTFPFMGKTNPEVFVAVTRDSVYYDPNLPAELVSLLRGLLRKNPVKRLGYGNQGWRQIQTHVFFSNLDWVGIKEQTVVAPPYENIAQESLLPSVLMKSSTSLAPRSQTSIPSEEIENIQSSKQQKQSKQEKPEQQGKQD